VDSIVSKIHETGNHVVKKSDLVLSRTREAGLAFFGEVRDAGRELAMLVRVEAKGWRRFLTQRSVRLKVEAKSVLTPKTFERELLTRVDGTLRSLDAKVRERIAVLEKRGPRSAGRKLNGKARARRASTSSTKSPTTKSATSATTTPVSVRH
jgi:hypothetical protein